MLQRQQTKRWWKPRMWEPSLENTPQVFFFCFFKFQEVPHPQLHPFTLTEHTAISAQSQPGCVWEWDVFSTSEVTMERLPRCATTPDAHGCPFARRYTVAPGISVHWSSATHVFIWNLHLDQNDWAFKAHGEPSLHSDLITSNKTCHLSRTFHISPLIYCEHRKGISHCWAPTLLDVQLHPEHPVFSVICGMRLTVTRDCLHDLANRD